MKSFIGTRIDTKVLDAFRKKAAKHGGISEVLRDLVVAFAEDRMILTPPQPKGIFKHDY